MVSGWRCEGCLMRDSVIHWFAWVLSDCTGKVDLISKDIAKEKKVGYR